MFLKDISRFSNTSDYLPIFNAALITDMFVILLTIVGYIKSKTLKEWYNKYTLAAVLADVLSIFIIIILARFLFTTFFSKYNIFLFILVAVLFQLFHDLSFYQLFKSVPRGKSQMLDTFKDYAKEMGAKILLADAQMIISTILIGTFLANFSFNTNFVVLIVALYITPYLIYSL
jgi:hypothetical protein